jgi:D-galacturonate reductase
MLSALSNTTNGQALIIWFPVALFIYPPARFDPVYSDARARAASLGEFNFFSAWMSQPKFQLATFKSWAGKDSDIRQDLLVHYSIANTDMPHSYYLSSHHIDICCWILQDKAIPTRVVASAATGIATSQPYNCIPGTEDTITLLVDWRSLTSNRHQGTAVFTASWTAPLNAGVHSAQHWYYLGEKVCFSSHPYLRKPHAQRTNPRAKSTSTRPTADMTLR